MGKKSLFESTSGPKKKAGSRKATTENKTTASGESPSTGAHETASPVTSGNDNLDRPVKKTAAAAPATDNGRLDEPDPLLQPEAPADKKRTRQVKKKAAPAAEARHVREIETPEPTGSEGDATFKNQPPSDFDPPGMGGSYLKATLAIIGGLLLLLCVASFFNSGNYHVRETRGAVEIWQGTFSPAGKTRLMVLPGAEWNQPAKSSYARGTVYAFAAGFHVEKALTLSDASRPLDYERIQTSLNQSLELFTEIGNSDAVNVIKQVGTYLTEAAILDASGEKEAMALAERKLEMVKHALSGLLIEKSAAPEDTGEGT